MGPADAAAHLLSASLEPYLAKADATQAKAEREILAIASEVAKQEAGHPEWNEHLTLEVFRRIETEHLALYEAAGAGGNQRALNRRLGRRIKEAARADAKMARDKAVVRNAPRGSQGLIRLYTLLTRRPATDDES